MDDLSIPACLNLRNPDVAARRERDRQAPVTAMPVLVERQRDMDEATRKFWEAERERERIEKENGLAAFENKKATKAKAILGGRFNSSLNRWITPEEDFAMMAENARTTSGDTVTVDELRSIFEDVATNPDYPPDGCAAFAKRTLATINNGKLALEAEKMLERMKRRLKRQAMANACAAKPRRRRAV